MEGAAVATMAALHGGADDSNSRRHLAGGQWWILGLGTESPRTAVSEELNTLVVTRGGGWSIAEARLSVVGCPVRGRVTSLAVEEAIARECRQAC